MAKFKKIRGSITTPLGFRAAARFCDVKTLGTGKGSDKGQKRDLALIVSDVPAKAAGMFTTNQICAAPVKLCVAHLRNNTARAVVINSGNANACTGPQGLADALEMAALTGQALGLKTTDVLVGSTGRIGVPLPMPNIRKGITAVAGQLQPTQAGAEQADSREAEPLIGLEGGLVLQPEVLEIEIPASAEPEGARGSRRGGGGERPPKDNGPPI